MLELVLGQAGWSRFHSSTSAGTTTRSATPNRTSSAVSVSLAPAPASIVSEVGADMGTAPRPSPRDRGDGQDGERSRAAARAAPQQHERRHPAERAEDHQRQGLAGQPVIGHPASASAANRPATASVPATAAPRARAPEVGGELAVPDRRASLMTNTTARVRAGATKSAPITSDSGPVQLVTGSPFAFRPARGPTRSRRRRYPGRRESGARPPRTPPGEPPSARDRPPAEREPAPRRTTRALRVSRGWRAST